MRRPPRLGHLKQHAILLRWCRLISSAISAGLIIRLASVAPMDGIGLDLDYGAGVERRIADLVRIAEQRLDALSAS